MSPVERLQSLSRDRLRPAYGRWLAPSVAASAAIHAVVLFLFVAPVEHVEAERPSDLVVIEERLPVPPPPREPARPAEPVLAEAPVEDEITIPETALTTAVPEPPEASRIAPEDGREDTIFRPYTEAPRCRENCSGAAILSQLPRPLREAGVTCALVLGLRIDTSGQVTDTRILRPSGHPACDRAAESWARTTAWTTAYNRDEPVTVWISQPIEVRSE